MQGNPGLEPHSLLRTIGCWFTSWLGGWFFFMNMQTIKWSFDPLAETHYGCLIRGDNRQKWANRNSLCLTMSKKGANFMICWLHTGNFSTDPLAVKVDTVLEAKTIRSILIPLPLYIMHLKWCSRYLSSPHLHGHAFRILHGKGLMTFAVKFPTNWKQQRMTFSICVTEICIEILQTDCRELRTHWKKDMTY
jgi:hypothetical protein